jgi:hypothetical protein
VSHKRQHTGVGKAPEIEDDLDYDIFHGTTAGGYCMLPPKQSHTEIESKIKKRKEKHQMKAAASRLLNVPGPIPTDEDKGYLTLSPSDVIQINTQGNILTGCATTGYLNLLMRQHYHASICCLGDNFVMRLQAMLGKHGSRGAWSKYVEQVSELQ